MQNPKNDFKGFAVKEGELKKSVEFEYKGEKHTLK